MRSRPLLGIGFLLLTASFAAAQEWPRFRGPNGSGVSAAVLPTRWTDKDYRWQVKLPGQPLCCGLTWFSTGQLGMARKMLARSIAALEAPAKAGVPIVGIEPSCTALFRGDAAELLGRTPGVTAVAESMKTLAELLARADGWAPPDLAGTTAIVQPHCHHRAVLGYSADLALLARAGVDARLIDGC